MKFKRIIALTTVLILSLTVLMTQSAVASPLTRIIQENPAIERLGLDKTAVADNNGTVELPDPGDLLDFEIPEQIDGEDVKQILDGAFKGCPYFRSVTIPASVTEIGEDAFAEASGLKYIILKNRTSTSGMKLGDNWKGSALVIFGDIYVELMESYTIEATAGTGGTIAPAGETSVMYGEDFTYTITPLSGHKIKDVKVDGESVGAVKTYTFEDVSEAHTIEAEFKPEFALNVGNATVSGLDGSNAMKSGYGFGIEIPCTVTNGTVSATATMSNGDTCSVELVNGKLVFVKNEDSMVGARNYYVPVDTKDGRFTCTVEITAVDKDDPDNIIEKTVTKTITIKGSMYEDDFTGDR